MKTVEDVFVQFRMELSCIYNIQEINAITLLILNDILKLSNAQLKAFPEIEIGDIHFQRLHNILRELKTARPVQYVLGHTEFYGLPFKVDNSVLIPRPETEELVQWIIETVKHSDIPAKRILDIGTGSGCIAITLKEYLTKNEIFALDISKEALKIAEINAKINQVDINFIETDILNFKHDSYLPDLDIIVSNPPYVTHIDKQQMKPNVTEFEPYTALFVPADDPLIFYIAIADVAKRKLTKNGCLFFEINECYGQQIVEMLSAKGFTDIELKQDMSGKDRMVRAYYDVYN